MRPGKVMRQGKYVWGVYILLYAILPIQQSQEMMIRQDQPPDPDDRQTILRGDPARNPAQKTVESMGLRACPQAFFFEPKNTKTDLSRSKKGTFSCFDVVLEH